MATHTSEERNGKLRTEVHLEPGETVALCRCYASKKFPFCDGSHRQEPGKVAPVIVHAPEASSGREPRSHPQGEAQGPRDEDSWWHRRKARASVISQPTLRTARLILRPFRLDDAPAVQRLAGARQVADTIANIPHPYPDGEAERWISTHAARYAAGKAVILAITLRQSGEVIGAIGLEINREHNRAELGYWVGVPYWNQGYCTEAARAVTQYAFHDLRLNRVHAVHLRRNPASGRVLQKIGMRYEGCLRQHQSKGDVLEDLECYGLLKGEAEAAE